MTSYSYNFTGFSQWMTRAATPTLLLAIPIQIAIILAKTFTVNIIAKFEEA